MKDLEAGKVRNDHPETAHSAATAIGSVSGQQRRLVDSVLRDHPEGLTDEEIQSVTELNPSSERPRRVELVESGHVVDSGLRRRTKSGREAIVWKRKARAT